MKAKKATHARGAKAKTGANILRRRQPMLTHPELEALKQVAQAMALAARTAPKARGRDLLAIAVLEPTEINRLAEEMERIGQEQQSASFLRDAANLRLAPYALLVGTRVQTVGLKVCGFCGFTNCAGCEQAGGVCAMASGDLGIALGSAAAVAAAAHADNRIMYSMGLAAIRLKLLGEDVRIAYGIPLSATGKNPFFDRK
jgi:uncharacterized ferredoxin-like protein